MADLSPDFWLDYIRALVVGKALFKMRKNLAQSGLAGFELLFWNPNEDDWTPSYLVASRPGRVEVHIAGTRNYLAQPAFFSKAVVSNLWNGGVVNRPWYEMAYDMYHGRIKRFLPDPSDRETEVRIYGHSYGGGVAQIVGDLDAMAGRFPARLRVVGLSCPMPYTAEVRPPEHRVDLLLNINDPVCYVPPEGLPIFVFDPVFGLIPYKDFVTKGWSHRGNQIWLKGDGTIYDGPELAYSLPITTEPIEFQQHTYEGYIWRLEDYAWKNNFVPDQRYYDLKTLLSEVNGDDDPLEDLKALNWFPGFPTDPYQPWNFPTYSASKGSNSTMGVMKVQIYYKTGDYDHSETHYYTNGSVDPANFDTVIARVTTYLKRRMMLFAPGVLPGTHLRCVGVRMTREGGEREGKFVFNPAIDFGTLVARADNEFEAGTDLPAVSALVEMRAGSLAKRQLYLRPVFNARYSDNKGTIVPQKYLDDRIKDLWNTYREQACWAIKAIDKVGQPLRKVTQINVAPSPVGGVYIVAPGLEVAAGQEISITGGKPFHKPVRGRYTVYAVTSDGYIHLTEPLTDVSLPGGCDIRKITYAYPLVDAMEFKRLTSHDTKGPTVLGRGSRRRRK